MSFGKMQSLIDIYEEKVVKDSEGFSKEKPNLIVKVRAYKEERHGSEMWKNRASFTKATTMFQFRKPPNIDITTDQFIVSKGIKYNIISVDDIRDKGMYIEALAEKITGSKG
ncbi:head-tail adaptor protein [Senegalia sp. (in: firmicutes)]|uniref:head-tail adaptor protein n=1 Tax=Senegalia sp. (in: firmicutes) TaxID=1924098 RepID=UPI003F9A476F